jgi:subtilisin family serine protease
MEDYMKRLFILLTACLVLHAWTGMAANPEWKPGEVLVKLQPDALSAVGGGRVNLSTHVQDDLTRLGAESWKPAFRFIDSSHGSDLYRWFTIKAQDNVAEVLLKESIDRLAYVEHTDLNYLQYPDSVPNDPHFDQQYAWEIMEATAAWSVVKGSPDVVVAIIDSGTDLEHEDLADALWYNPGETPNGEDSDGNGYVDDYRGWDFRNNDNDPGNGHPENMHGTHVAGIVGAVNDNGIGIAGGTWGSELMILKVFADEPGGGAWVSHVAEAIIYAADNGASVVNLSLGSSHFTDVQADAVLYAYNAGVTVLAAAGNGGATGIGHSTPHYPAAHIGAFGVGATNPFENKAGMSNYGDWVAFFAPGVNIRSCMPNNEYSNSSGTSMASPAAAALAALIKTQNPLFTPDQIIERMILGAENIDEHNPSYRGALSAGRLNFYFSVAQSPVLRIDRWVVDDSDGNMNFEADYGETVDLDIWLHNHSWMDGTGITAAISAGPGITVNNPTATYGNINNNSTGKNNAPFTLTVTETNHTTIPITVAISADGGYNNTVILNLSVNNPVPQLPGFPVYSHDSFYSSPRVADINNDGNLEIITASLDGTIHVLHMDGTPLEGWPRNITPRNEMHNSLILQAPAIADLDGNGFLEIIIADRLYEHNYKNPNNPQAGTELRMPGRIHVFQHDGSDFEGYWPFITDIPATDPEDAIDAGFRSAPTVADVTGDGHLEIIVGNYLSNVLVLDTMGNILPGWPINLGKHIFASAAVFDYTGDGKNEIVIVTKNNDDPLDKGDVFMFTGAGQLMPGFPLVAPNQIYSAPVLADLNGNDIPELVFGFGDYWNELGPKGVMAMNMRSGVLHGFPVDLPDAIYGTPALGDLDNDGFPEIVVGTLGSQVYAIKRDGTIMPGFPVTVSTHEDSTILSSPVIADINNSGTPEIIVCSEISFRVDAFMHIIKADGTFMDISPIQLDQVGFPSPVIADITKNGTPEIVMLDSNISVFNVNTQHNPDKMYWTTFHGNNHASGLYEHETPLETGINLMLTERMFHGGQHFTLDMTMTNAENHPYQNLKVFGILDVYSMYWFFPSWSEDIDWFEYNTLEPGTTVMNILTFEWPTNVQGGADNLIFWGGMLDQNDDLLGNIDYAIFGYGL